MNIVRIPFGLLEQVYVLYCGGQSIESLAKTFKVNAPTIKRCLTLQAKREMRRVLDRLEHRAIRVLTIPKDGK